MKAIILAGGNGTRLHPISLGLPKPMTTLVNKPLIEHIIKLLERNGLSDICMTLRYLPKVITDYFGDGSHWGVNLTSHIENTPLGTAGGIKACKDFLASDDFIVISGDAACELNLQQLISSHYKNNAEVTIALYKSDKPLEYGLVMTDSGGRVERFIEKPSRDRVYTDLVNTGIYIISNSILDEIPENTPYDFARDLFPKLLSQNRRIFGIPFEGYWCDVGSCISYLRANFDALAGKLPFYQKLGTHIHEIEKSIWTGTGLNNKAVYKAPCYIGEGVTIGNGSVIGPFAIIADGSTIGQGAVIKGSIIDGAWVDERSKITGSVVCRGAKIGSDSMLCEGSVIGESVTIGRGSLINEGVRIWPNKNIPSGSKIKSSIISGMHRQGPMFEIRGIISGELGLEITPELCLSLGASADANSVGIAHSGGEFARIISECFGCGAASSGSQIFQLDAAIAATASFASAFYKLDMTLFAEQKGKEITLWFFNNKGLPITRDMERKLEGSTISDSVIAEAEKAGSLSRIDGTFTAHAAAASNCIFKHDPKTMPGISVTGRNQSSRLLKSAIKNAGFEIVDNNMDTAALEPSPDGFSLTLRDENGQIWDHGKLLTALALVEFEHGFGNVVLPYSAPAAAEVLASRLGGNVLRLGRDGSKAEDEMQLRPFASDAYFLSLRLLSALCFYDNNFASLMARVPTFFTSKREVMITCDRGLLMRELSRFNLESSTEFVSGLKINTGNGQAHIIPKGDNRFKILSEGPTEEIAEEICLDFENILKEINGKQQI